MTCYLKCGSYDTTISVSKLALVLLNLAVSLACNANIEVKLGAWTAAFVNLWLAFEVNIDLNFEDALVVAIVVLLHALLGDSAVWLVLDVEFDLKLGVSVSLLSASDLWLKINIDVDLSIALGVADLVTIVVLVVLLGAALAAVSTVSRHLYFIIYIRFFFTQ